MSAGKIILIIALVGVGMLVLFGVLVGILAVATIPKLAGAKADLELKQLADLSVAFNGIALDWEKRAKLRQMPEGGGREFYDSAFRNNVLDPVLLGRIVSLEGEDSVADRGAADPMTGMRLGERNCSYTAPRSGELMTAMNVKGKKRVVLVTFNSRNWNNYPDRGIAVIWSSSEIPEWLTFQQAQTEWGITLEEWNDPAGKLFGKKMPFLYTYE